MSNWLNISISSIYFDGIINDRIPINCEQTVRMSIITYLDSHHINHSDCSIIFSNIETEFRGHSLVVFLNSEPLEPFVDEPVKNLTDLFNINQMNLSIDIGGIGGEIDRKNGIIYYIRSRNEHLPKHIHCKKQSKQCKCIIDTLAIEQGKNSNTHFSTREQSEIRDYVKKNREYILQKWTELNPNLT